jgi:hypothetical protein
MSNEVNIVETFRGTIDPGWSWQFYDWSGDYNVTRIKARFFTVEPDPDQPLGTGDRPQHLDLEITRVWETVWVGTDGRYAFQRNVEMANIGTMTAGYHILRAETDN